MFFRGPMTDMTTPSWIDENYACSTRSSPPGGRFYIEGSGYFATSRLHDTGVKFSLEYKNRGENNASAKVAPVSCKQPLTIIANIAFNKQNKTIKLD